MSDAKIEEQRKIEEEKRKRGREIFDNVFAYSIEEIGTILYKDEAQAKEYIRDGLVINSIDYFSSSKAKQILEINKSKSTEHLKYLQIIYRLNPKLPYKFNNVEYENVRELSTALFKNPKSGIEHLQQGNIEIWLKECQPENYKKLLKIRDTAKNLNLAFLEFIYTFNPDLPFRLSNNVLVKSEIELCNAINENKESWNAGRVDLFDSSIIVWLKTIGKSSIVEKWEDVKVNYLKSKDVGLEVFLHQLNDNLDYPIIEISKKSLSFPKIQIGSLVNIKLNLINKTRGYVQGDITYSKVIDGVSVSSKSISINSVTGPPNVNIDFNIDSTNLKKGVDYKTSIKILTSVNQQIEIPVSFRLVFPKNAFIKEIIKYALLFAVIGGIYRGVVSLLGFPGWISDTFQYYILHTDVEWQQKPEIFFFPLIFIIMIIFLTLLLKKWKRIVGFIDKI